MSDAPFVLRERGPGDDERLAAAWSAPATFAFLPAKTDVDEDWVRAALEALPDDLRTAHFALLTSGSTGPSKGVTHSLATLGAMCRSAADAFALTPEDVFLPASSLSHVGAFLWTFTSLSVGARAIVVRAFDAHSVLPLLREHRPTVMAMIPAARPSSISTRSV